MEKVDWERIVAVIRYDTIDRVISPQFIVCYSEHEIEEHRLQLLFDDKVKQETIRIRGK